MHTDATASSCASQLEQQTYYQQEHYCPDPTSEDHAAQPSLSTQAATADCVQRDEAGSCDQRAEHAAPEASQEEVTERTNVEVHVEEK